MKFNPNNQGHLTQHYPLFLGQPLGVIDTINVTYPELEKLYQKQVAQIWNEFEVDITQDRMDMMIVPPQVTDLMVKTIMWQTVADSVAARSILETLGKFITNTELMNLATLWTFFEVIHGRTYSHIIKQTFRKPNDMLVQLYNEAEVLQRSDIIVKVFEDMETVPVDADPEVIRSAILKTLVALLALEGIAFMSSFAVTFGIAETRRFAGIGQLVKLICRDEVLHTRFTYSIISSLMEDPEWKRTFYLIEDELKAILDSVVKQECEWADYLFSEGREVVGLNANLLKDYTLFSAQPIYKLLNLDYDHKVVDEDPLPYMDTWINGKKVQAAPQEIQITNYLVGAVVDDSGDVDFGDM